MPEMASSGLKMHPAVRSRHFARARRAMHSDIVSEPLQAPQRAAHVASASVTSPTLRQLSDLPGTQHGALSCVRRAALS